MTTDAESWKLIQEYLECLQCAGKLLEFVTLKDWLKPSRRDLHIANYVCTLKLLRLIFLSRKCFDMHLQLTYVYVCVGERGEGECLHVRTCVRCGFVVQTSHASVVVYCICYVCV